jgi:polygalacturonase
MNRILPVVGLLAGGALAAPTLPTLPTIPSRTLVATSFGVVADSATDNAAALQKALDSVSTLGGGTLELPAAKKPYLTGPIVMRSSTQLELDSGAILQMLPYGRYPMQSDSSYLPMVSASGAHDIALSGKGTLEGDGSAWWTAYEADKISRPAMFSVTTTVRILLSDVRFRNAPNVHTTFHYSITDLTMRRVNIQAPSTSPNTDGCDFEGLRALFDHDSIQNGDDNIAIQPGHDSTAEITVQDCFFGTGHGLSIGSWCNKGVRDMLSVRDTFVGTTSGIRMKAGRDRGGDVRDLVYQDIVMTDVQNPLYITSYYPSDPATTASDTVAPVTATTPWWRNIQVTNLTSTSAIKGYNSVVIYALPEAAVDSLTLTNVKITAPNAFSIQHSHAMLFTGVTYDGTSSWFGTARDTSWRKASVTTAVASIASRPCAHRIVEGRLLVAGSGMTRVRALRADGASRELFSCQAPCTRALPQELRGGWVEVEQAGARGAIPVPVR